MRFFAATLLVLLASLHLSCAVTWTIIAAPGVAEGNNGTTTAYTVNITRNDNTLATDVGISTVSTNAANSANLASDIVALTNQTVTFNAGDDWVTATITIVGDAIYELNETFIITLSVDPADTFTNFTTTIINDDPPPVIAVTAAPTTEGNSGPKTVTMLFTMNRPSELTCIMNWATQAGTALVGLDFVAKVGQNVFAPGQLVSSNTTTILGDLIDEPTEGFLIVNAGSVNCAVAPGQIGILDDDGPPNLNITLTSSVVEGNSGVQLLNFLMNVYPLPSGFSIIVNFTLNSTTATQGTDFILPSGGGVVIPPGSAQSNLWIRVVGEQLFEADEWVALTITTVTNAVFTGPDNFVNGTIINDDPLPSLSVVDIAFVEGNSPAPKNITISTGAGWIGFPVLVNWTLANGTAGAGEDFVFANGASVVSAGSGAATVAIIGDSVAEPTNETFILAITAVGCVIPGCAFLPTITKNNGTITIIDDDTPILYITGTTVTESATAFITFTVTIQVAQSTDIVFDWAVTGGTATAGVDFTASAGNDGTILAGQTTATFNVPILDDTESEPTESVVFTINSVVSGPGRIVTATANGYIADSPSDPLPTLYTYNTTVIEGDNGTTPGYVQVSLSFASSRIVNVTWATRDETAYSPVDYLTGDGWIAFQPGETTKNITVYVVGDTIEEPQTAFTVRLSAVSNANFGNFTAGVIISDDDALITAAVQSDVYEGSPDFNPRFIGLIVIIGIVVIAIIASIVGFFALKRYVS